MNIIKNSILDRLKENGVFSVELSPDKKIVIIMQEYETNGLDLLDKDQLFKLITELRSIHNKMT